MSNNPTPPQSEKPSRDFVNPLPVLASTKNNIVFLFIIFFAAALVGLVAVAYNHAFNWGTDIARQSFFENPLTKFLTVPLFFLLSAWLCRKFAPNASGGGPDQVIAALQKLSIPGQGSENIAEYLSFKIIVVKIVSSIICIMGGGALGREGPVVQISSSIFVLIAQKTKKILPHFDLRTWIIAGSAAGLAAAFNTPLAGIIFAIEELSQFHFEKQFSEFKNKAFFAVIVAGVSAQLLTGSYVLFEFPQMHFIWQIKSALVLLLVAVACGFSAWLLRKYIVWATLRRNNIQGLKWYLFPILTGLIVASVTNSVGINSFGAGMYTIQETLKSSVAILSFEDFLGRFINIVASAASGCAGGLLLPALALGAGVGSMGSMLIPLTDSRIFVATGMAAFLGAMLNAPLTAAVLVLEVTNQRELILPLFLSTLTASWICNYCNGTARLTTRIAMPGR